MNEPTPINQLFEWEAKRDYRWNWMWRSLIAIFANPVIWHRWSKLTKNNFLFYFFFFGGVFLGTVIWIILFLVCLVGWILARNECGKFAAEEADVKYIEERERVCNLPKWGVDWLT